MANYLPNTEDNIIREAIKLANHCLLPKLKTDIGSQHFDRNTFTAFFIELNNNLNQLLDVLHQNPKLLQPGHYDNDSLQEFHIALSLLYCEQTAKHALYRTDQDILLQSIQSWDGLMDIFMKTEMWPLEYWNRINQRLRTTCGYEIWALLMVWLGTVK